jgi:hypothetical protein
MPKDTLGNLIVLAKRGATIIFEGHLPKDAPGWGTPELRALNKRSFEGMLAEVMKIADGKVSSSECRGRILIGDLDSTLNSAKIPRETLFDQTGLMCIRRGIDDGEFYFIANRGEKVINGPVPLATAAKSVVLLDPMSGRTGVGSLEAPGDGTIKVLLQLAPGESIIVRAIKDRTVSGPAWVYRDADGTPVALNGKWKIRFIQGGPQLPAALEADQLESWTTLGDTNAQRFAGTALYSFRFDAPAGSAKSWQLDLGKVCQSARVRLNGRDLGTLITPPFRVTVDNVKKTGNVLEVEVTNVSANRIRDLDRRGVEWKTFNDINFVNLNYRPFDASNWPVRDSGLIGPVTLTPLKAVAAR